MLGFMESIITQDKDMERIFNIIRKVSPSNSTVLILGESGTGKELIARGIHESSGISGPFVPVNCGAIPENLLESELFGHEKGAFTGAINSKPGRFALAEGGTIFLDEIGEMAPSLQVKLLRVLQERVIEPVGAIRSKKVNVRIVAATNVNLQQLVDQGKFREDLFYRLQVVPITIPALRERSDDIELLLNHFIQGQSISFAEETMEVLKSYSWPGNVRELEHLVERLLLLVEGNTIELSDLPGKILNSESNAEILELDLPESGIDFNRAVSEFENNLIVQALSRTKGNKKAAADLLKLNRTTLVEKIKKKQLSPAPFINASVWGPEVAA